MLTLDSGLLTLDSGPLTTEGGDDNRTSSGEVPNSFAPTSEPNFPHFEPGEFDLPAFFERLYDRHPKKSNRNIAIRYLEEALRSVSPDELEAGHNAWCECEQWQDGGGRYVKQDLAQWILDQGWKYAPPGNEGSGSAKSLANEYQR